MKILQTISGLAASSGGPSTCTCDLMNALHSVGAPVELLTVAPKDNASGMLGKGMPWLHTVKDDCIPPFMTSSNFNRTLEESDYDLYHTNGIWMGVNHSTCRIARRKDRKYVISPHGMLYPNALRINYWKKWLLLKMWYDKDIGLASCLHATCRQEARFIREFGYRGPVAVIGNAVTVPGYVRSADRKPDDRICIGFLGRLHPIKRVERVLYGMAECPGKVQARIRFKIMGKGGQGYEDFLKGEIRKYGLEENVEFTGFVTGREKYNLLAGLHALFVPSESENFGMIIPEALVCGTPVFASTGTPWETLNDIGCGWWMDATAENIRDIIVELSGMDTEEILEMGRKGGEFVRSAFSPETIATQMLDLYGWLLSGGRTPDFIYE